MASRRRRGPQIFRRWVLRIGYSRVAPLDGSAGESTARVPNPARQTDNGVPIPWDDEAVTERM